MEMGISGTFLKNVKDGTRLRFKKIFHNPYRKVNINWIYLKYLKHIPPGGTYHHRLFNKTVWFHRGSEYLHGIREIFLDEIYKQSLHDKPFIIDCGANIGLSVIYLKQNYPDAQIIAFEPDEQNFELLSKNIESFGFKDVVLREEAVWIADTTLQFSNQGSMGSKVVSGPGVNFKEVAAVRLKNFLDRKIDFLKIDIEGAEYRVVNDLGDNLRFVQNLFIEYHGDFNQNSELTNLLNLITAQGFNFYIKEAASVYNTPFYRTRSELIQYDIQLNIFCFRLNEKTKG